MSQISEFKNPWRDILLSAQASFRGVMFHVETSAVSSGRRTVVHEYPKRNTPYSEDMGRSVRRLNFSGYLVYRPSNPLYVYTDQRISLYKALEADDAGPLIHPVYCPDSLLVMCDRFSMTESRERGGYTTFEMQFVEAGTATLSAGVSSNSSSVVNQMAKAIEGVHTAPAGPVGTATGTISIRPVQE